MNAYTVGQIPGLLGLFCGSLILLSFIWVKRRRKLQSVFKELNIPYVEPNLISGSLSLLRSDGGRNYFSLIEKWLKRHGKVFGIYIGWNPTLIITDLDTVHQILVKEFQSFVNRPELVIPAQPVTDTLVGLRNQRWKDIRYVLAPTFSMSKMKTMLGIFHRKIDVMMTVINKTISRDEPVEMLSVYQGLTLDSICECVLALETNCQKLQNEDFLFRSVRQYLKSAFNSAIVLALYFPFIAFLMGLVSNYLSMSGRLTRVIVSNLKKVIAIRRKNLTANPADVLQLMLEASAEHAAATNNVTYKNNPSRRMTDDEIIANAWVFLLGGFETTSSALTLTTYLLAKHPDVQEKLFDELCSVTMDGTLPLSYDVLRNATYLDQIFNESLRLYPPVVSFITREAKNDIQIKHTFIPKGMVVSIPVWHIHRDPDVWEDPDTFDPERFCPTKQELRHPMCHLPFGAGPRGCIGKKFAILEAKLALARVVMSFRVECCEQTPQKLTFTIPTVALHPVEKIFLKLTPRRYNI